MAIKKLDAGCGVLTSMVLTVRLPLRLVRQLKEAAVAEGRERDGYVSHRTLAREILEKHFDD